MTELFSSESDFSFGQNPALCKYREQRQKCVKLQLPQKAKRRVSKGLTAWVASEDISSGFIVQENEEGVGEGTEPPAWLERVHS